MTLYDFLNAHYFDMAIIFICVYCLALGAVWGAIHVAEQWVEAYRESWQDDEDEPPSVGIYGKV